MPAPAPLVLGTIDMHQLTLDDALVFLKFFPDSDPLKNYVRTAWPRHLSEIPQTALDPMVYGKLRHVGQSLPELAKALDMDPIIVVGALERLVRTGKVTSLSGRGFASAGTTYRLTTAFPAGGRTTS